MARQYKIKRSYGGSNTYRAKPHPLAVIGAVLAIAGLIFVGISIYEPVVDFFSRLANPSEVEIDPLPEVESSEPEPEPEPEPVAITYPEMRAVYMPAAIASDAASLSTFLDKLSGTEINTVLVDIKDTAGNVLFITTNARAIELEAITENAYDIAELAGTLRERNLMLAVRMTAFRDAKVASVDRDIAIHYQDSDWLWLDNTQDAGGRPWLNPYSPGAQEYLSSLALEAAEAGAGLVVLDHFQFPTGSAENAGFGDTSGLTRDEILASYLAELTALLEGAGARTAVQFNAVNVTQDYENSTRYGSGPLAVSGSTIALGCLPDQYSAGFTFGSVTVEQPAANPASSVEASLRLVMDELPLANDNPCYIPILLGGNEPGITDATPYTKAQVDEQIEAVKARGIGEYILYTSDGSYLLS